MMVIAGEMQIRQNIYINIYYKSAGGLDADLYLERFREIAESERERARATFDHLRSDFCIYVNADNFCYMIA